MSNTKQKVLITGSCGFIFSSFIRKALYWQSQNKTDKYSFVSVDRVAENTNVAASIYANKDHKFYIGDITDQHIMDTIFQLEKPDIVVHGAAESCVDTSLTNPNAFITSNVLGTQIMLNVATKYKVKKFVYISTDEV